MGEAKRKSRSGRAIIASELRCIYCAGPAETVEHMPPRGMFRDRQRPGSMEFGVCKSCNDGTRGSDAVAAWMARVHPDNDIESWQTGEISKLISSVDTHAPGIREEMSLPGKARFDWMRRPGSGLFQQVVKVHADGPRLHAHLCVFGAKLAMALYREHIGAPLPLDGAVWCQFALNAGMMQKDLEARIKILPLHGTLRQGRKNVGNQFSYRYNCDDRTVIAAVAQFHGNLWFTIFASSDQRIIAIFENQDTLSLPASALIRPGQLLSLLPPANRTPTVVVEHASQYV